MFASVADELYAKYVFLQAVYRRRGCRPLVSGADRALVSELAERVVAKRAGPSASASALAAVARRTYDDLAGVAAPLIGAGGVEALTSRAVHLARRRFLWLGSDGDEPPTHDEDSFAGVARRLEEAEASTAADAAGALFGLVASLLATLIGEGLTASLLYKAWPDAFPMPAKRSEHD